MRRRFVEHDLREVTSLDGVWDFVYLGDVDADAVDVASLTFDDRMAVPGCWDATPKYAGKRGLAAYRTTLRFTDSTRHRVKLDGVHHWCRVFVDGKCIGEHAGGFTEFSYDLPSPDVGESELVILVDNRFDDLRSPLHKEYFDWYHFGGISHGVRLERLGKHWIESARIETLTVDPPLIRVALTVNSDGQAEQELEFMVNGESVDAYTLAIDGQETRHHSFGFGPEQLAAWSPDAPNLHTLYIRYGDDDLRERFGVREVRVEGQQIMINEEPVRLLGFNRHEAHPQFGNALPEQLLISDVQQLKDMGCNFVRGSHYPQDSLFLDMCDEVGLLVWSETTGWQHTAEHLNDPVFMEAQLRNLDEMVAISRNHPSVIMWGILNESHSHDMHCRDGYSALLTRYKKLDETRPVTYATNHPFEDLNLDLVDIVSVNCYPGWYGSAIEDIPAAIDKIVAHLDANGQADKPIIISEIGAGAIPGWRDWNGARWSEQYQVHLLDQVIRYMFAERDRFAGLAIWQFCDLRISEAVQKILGRPRGFNNKGVVDEYRRPKQAYTTVKDWFRKLNG